MANMLLSKLAICIHLSCILERQNPRCDYKYLDVLVLLCRAISTLLLSCMDRKLRYSSTVPNVRGPGKMKMKFGLMARGKILYILKTNACTL